MSPAIGFLLLLTSNYFLNRVGRMRPALAALPIFLIAIFWLTGCTSSPRKLRSAGAVKPVVYELSPAARLGRLIFFDPTLSASGRVACSSCHDPAHAYGPPNALAGQIGGANLDRQGARAVPSLRYTLLRVPLWHQERAASRMERYEELAKGDNPPTGGLG